MPTFSRARTSRPMRSRSIPILGGDSLEPWIDRAAAHGKGLYVLLHTSNPGSQDLQVVKTDTGDRFVDRVGALLHAAGKPHVSSASGWSLVGAVVGATHPRELAHFREAMPHTAFLVPGFGAQGATAADVAPAFRHDGSGAVVNASRSVIHPPA